MRVSVGKELRETHRRNEAGLLAEAIAQGVAEDPRSRRVALPIPHPHPLCQVDLHQVAGDCGAFAPRAGPALLLSFGLWGTGQLGEEGTTFSSRCRRWLKLSGRTSRFDPVPPNI
jgi:hypothetical protein